MSLGVRIGQTRGTRPLLGSSVGVELVYGSGSGFVTLNLISRTGPWVHFGMTPGLEEGRSQSDICEKNRKMEAEEQYS